MAAMLSNGLFRTDVFIFRWVSLQPYRHQLLCKDLAERLLFLQKPWKLAEGSDFMAASTVFILLQIQASSQGLLCIISKFNFFISSVSVVAAASFVRTIKHSAGRRLRSPSPSLHTAKMGKLRYGAPVW